MITAKKLSEVGMLMTLKTGKFSTNKRDKNVEKIINGMLASSTNADTGVFTKKIVATTFVKKINHLYTAGSQFHKDNTSYWPDIRNTGILLTKNYANYTSVMNTFKTQILEALEEFKPRWPEAIEEARLRLSKNPEMKMFDLSDYPTIDEVMSRYKFEWKPSPIPTEGSFPIKDLHEKEITQMRAEFEAEFEAKVNEIKKETFGRLYEPIKKMIDTLADPDNDGFRGSLVTNIEDVAKLLPYLNIDDDPKLNDLQQDVLDSLTMYSSKLLKSSNRIRTRVLTEAERIMKDVEAFM